MSGLLTRLRTLLAKLKALPFVEKVGLTFAHGFTGVFLLGITGLLGSVDSKNLSTSRDAVVALVVASTLAGVHAVQHLLQSKLSKTS